MDKDNKDNNNIKILPKEDILEEPERWFTGIIKFIEKETINDEERLALFSTYNRGIKAAINLFYDTKNRIEYQKDPLMIYILGVKESTYIVKNMIDDMLKLVDKKQIEINEEKMKISFIQVFIKGIKLATDLYQKNKLDEGLIKVIEDLDSILSVYEGKEPEDVWEKIRNRIGVSIKF